MYLTLSHGGLTEHILFFSEKPCLLTHTVAHIYLVAAQLNHFFFILGCWAALLKQFRQSNRGDKEHQNSCWESFTHSVPPMRFFFILCEDWNQWPSKHILASLIFSVTLIFDNDDTSVNVCPDLYIVNSFSSFSLPFRVTHPLFFSFFSSHTADRDIGVSH